MAINRKITRKRTIEEMERFKQREGPHDHVSREMGAQRDEWQKFSPNPTQTKRLLAIATITYIILQQVADARQLEKINLMRRRLERYKDFLKKRQKLEDQRYESKTRNKAAERSIERGQKIQSKYTKELTKTYEEIDKLNRRISSLAEEIDGDFQRLHEIAKQDYINEQSAPLQEKISELVTHLAKQIPELKGFNLSLDDIKQCTSALCESAEKCLPLTAQDKEYLAEKGLPPQLRQHERQAMHVRKLIQEIVKQKVSLTGTQLDNVVSQIFDSIVQNVKAPLPPLESYKTDLQSYLKQIVKHVSSAGKPYLQEQGNKITDKFGELTTLIDSRAVHLARAEQLQSQNPSLADQIKHSFFGKNHKPDTQYNKQQKPASGATVTDGPKLPKLR